MSNLRPVSESEVNLFQAYKLWQQDRNSVSLDCMNQNFDQWSQERFRIMEVPYGGYKNRICDVVMKHAGLTGAQFYSRRKEIWIAWPRMLAMYLMINRLPSATSVSVGKFLSRDHSTICSGRKRAMELIKTIPEMRKLHDDVVAELEGEA